MVSVLRTQWQSHPTACAFSPLSHTAKACELRTQQDQIPTHHLHCQGLTLPHWEYVQKGNSDRKENRRHHNPHQNGWGQNDSRTQGRSPHTSVVKPLSQRNTIRCDKQTHRGWDSHPNLKTRNASILFNKLDLWPLSGEFKVVQLC